MHSLEKTVIRRVSAARHLHRLALQSLSSNNDIELFSAINLLQDSIELFLLAVATHVNATIKEKAQFADYFQSINEKSPTTNIHFKSELLLLNKMRVNSKHYGIPPDRDELIRLSLYVEEFLKNSCEEIFNKNFYVISIIDTLEDCEVKGFLIDAKNCIENLKYAEALIACRKALYVTFEFRFDISVFDTEKRKGGLLIPRSLSPEYAQTDRYFEEFVLDPTDFIVYDRERMNQILLERGINVHTFWELLKLTPDLYLHENNTWLSKWDHFLTKNDINNENTLFVFENTVEIIRATQSYKTTRGKNLCEQYQVKTINKPVNVYKKASTHSDIIFAIESSWDLQTQYQVDGFEKDGPYWYVSFMHGQKRISGFVHDDDILDEIKLIDFKF